MPLFVMSCLDKAGSGELRARTRPAHLAYLDANPVVVGLAGPYIDDSGLPIGSMFIMEGEDRAAIEAFAAKDPWWVVIGQLA